MPIIFVEDTNTWYEVPGFVSEDAVTGKDPEAYPGVFKRIAGPVCDTCGILLINHDPTLRRRCTVCEKAISEENEREMAEHDRVYKIWDKICDKHDLYAIWSIYEQDDPSKIFAEGDIEIVYEVDSYWSDKKGPFKVQLTNPTFEDVYVACDKLIQNSGDPHHIFIEAVEPTPEHSRIYQLYAGS